ncbi:hypothetical protein BKI52_37100 [marine bacterium AO1-C]|nr:hypothetical protein BKI52_37100 [marine bacterium AO1-C]
MTHVGPLARFRCTGFLKGLLNFKHLLIFKINVRKVGYKRLLGLDQLNSQARFSFLRAIVLNRNFL